MRYFRIIITLFLFSITATLNAQETVPATAWEIIERCPGELPYPTLPRSQWDFEGVIFSQNNEGIRAIRTDFETSYFIALASAHAFPWAGQFSQDGRWFAYPVGITQRTGSTSQMIIITTLRVISTGPDGIHYDIPWKYISFSGIYFTILEKVRWIDNETFVYRGNAVGIDTEITIPAWYIKPFINENELPRSKLRGIKTIVVAEHVA